MLNCRALLLSCLAGRVRVPPRGWTPGCDSRPGHHPGSNVCTVAPPRQCRCDVEVTETPGQGGDHPRPLLTVGPADRLLYVDPGHANGRTSTFRLQAFDPSAA